MASATTNDVGRVGFGACHVPDTDAWPAAPPPLTLTCHGATGAAAGAKPTMAPMATSAMATTPGRARAERRSIGPAYGRAPSCARGTKAALDEGPISARARRPCARSVAPPGRGG